MSLITGNDEAALQRTVDADCVPLDAAIIASPDDFFELSRVIEWVRAGEFTRVALQFPDELLGWARWTLAQLTCRAPTNCQFAVLADSPYAPCCADTVAAQRWDAQALVHFGRACLDTRPDLPVCYVFGRMATAAGSAELDALAAALTAAVAAPAELPLLVVYDFRYPVDAARRLCEALRGAGFQRTYMSLPDLPDVPADADYCTVSGRRLPRCCLAERSQLALLFLEAPLVASPAPTLTQMLLSLRPGAGAWRWLSAPGHRLESVTAASDQLLRRRLALVTRARDAQRVGLVVAATGGGVRRSAAALRHLEALVLAAGRRPYALVLGRLDALRLSNLPELELFVLLGCPESCLMDGRARAFTDHFPAPTVSPYELELALSPERCADWEALGQCGFVTQLSDLLPGGQHHRAQPVAGQAPGPQETYVSMVTGKLMTLGLAPSDATGDPDEPNTRALMTRGERALLEIGSAVPGALASRSWRGLDPGLASEPAPVQLATRGLRGLPIRYEDEPALGT